MLKSTIFREYDIRGIADVDLPSPDVRVLGQAFGTYIQRKTGKEVNLGYDCRLSGPRLKEAFLAGLLDSGCEVTELGVVPTPLVYYSLYNLKADGSIQITGSHNPADYNGFKGGTSFGETDEFCYKAVQDPVHVHDMQATILHQLGIHHEKLTFRYQGRDFRLTDVHGEVVKGIIA